MKGSVPMQSAIHSNVSGRFVFLRAAVALASVLTLFGCSGAIDPAVVKAGTGGSRAGGDMGSGGAGGGGGGAAGGGGRPPRRPPPPPRGGRRGPPPPAEHAPPPL